MKNAPDTASDVPTDGRPPAVGYVSPFVPGELLSACGVRPVRLTDRDLDDRDDNPSVMGACSFARRLVAAAGDRELDGVIFTTTCDQMRRAAEAAERTGATVFLLNVPTTWERPGALRQYTGELRRLIGFLESLGGRAADDADLREAVQRAAPPIESPIPRPPGAVPLAVVGPHLLGRQELLETIARAGGTMVLDGLEGGPRSAPLRPDRRELPRFGLDDLAANYFCGPVDAFRRPDSALLSWLVRECRTAGARGIVLLHYAWCDQWSVLADRIGRATGLPVVELELTGEEGDAARVYGRVSVLVEMLRG